MGVGLFSELGGFRGRLDALAKAERELKAADTEESDCADVAIADIEERHLSFPFEVASLA